MTRQDLLEYSRVTAAPGEEVGVLEASYQVPGILQQCSLRVVRYEFVVCT